MEMPAVVVHGWALAPSLAQQEGRKGLLKQFPPSLLHVPFGAPQYKKDPILERGW